MTVTETDIGKIQAMIGPILGQKAWNVSLGHGSFITMEFGVSLLSDEIDRQPRGEWHLWVYCCAWRLEEGNNVLASSEDSRLELELAVKRMAGLALRSIKIFRPAWDSIFTFEEQVVLRLFSIYSKECEHWMLFMPNGNDIIIGSGTKWSCESN